MTTAAPVQVPQMSYALSASSTRRGVTVPNGEALPSISIAIELAAQQATRRALEADKAGDSATARLQWSLAMLRSKTASMLRARRG